MYASDIIGHRFATNGYSTNVANASVGGTEYDAKCGDDKDYGKTFDITPGTYKAAVGFYQSRYSRLGPSHACTLMHKMLK